MTKTRMGYCTGCGTKSRLTYPRGWIDDGPVFCTKDCAARMAYGLYTADGHGIGGDFACGNCGGGGSSGVQSCTCDDDYQIPTMVEEDNLQ